MNQMEALAIVEPGRRRLCFMCKWIYEDIQKNGELTDYPMDAMGKGQFPVSGKLLHLDLEKTSQENR